MVEVRFKPADVGTVADGAITDVKINASANITMSKLNLSITDSEVAAGASIAKTKLAALEIANADVAVGAAIAKTKLAALDIGDSDVNTITVTKVTGAVDGRAATTSGDKDITAVGWDSVTDEIVYDHEA